MIDSTHIKAHRSASGGKGGSKTRRLVGAEAATARKSMQLQMLRDVFFPSFLTGGEAHDYPIAEPLINKTKAAKKFLADKAYDSGELRNFLKKRGTKPVIPNKSNRKQPFSFNKRAYGDRRLIENAFCRRKKFRRIATRYNRQAVNFAASIYLVATVV